jgi:beta-N-acetylhexosaminidase
MIPANLKKSVSLQQMVGQMIIAGFKGKKVHKTSDIHHWIKSYNIGGVLLYDLEMTQEPPGKRNIESPEQVKQLTQRLQHESQFPLFIAVDQEGGIVNRLTSEYGFPDFPSWQKIGEKNNFNDTKLFASSIANTLHNCGINLNFAPVLDIQKNHETAVGKEGRSISTDPNLIFKHSKIFINEHRKKQIATSGKHFPGQGSALQDAHEEITNISETWDESELIPYKELIKNNNLDAVMVGHVLIKSLDETYPASLSIKIIDGLLRKKMNFNGVVICDDPVMKAISENYPWEDVFKLMINAGIDIICLGNNLKPYRENLIPESVEMIMSMVKNGKIPINRIEESYQRIQNLKSTLF